MRLCPHEGIDLVESRVKGFLVSQCSTCSGLWIPSVTVSAVFANTPHPPAQSTANAGFRQCPDDRSRLRAIIHHGIEIDRCDACGGIWLDHGELERILARKKARSVAGRALETAGDVAGGLDPGMLVELAGDALGAVLEFVGDALSGW